MSIKIDYISIVFDSARTEEVIRRVLELPIDIFTKYPAKVKHKSYQSLHQAGSIKVFGDSKQTEDSFGDLFRHCERLYGSKFRFTRLDIAIDDRNETPFFTPEQIKRKCEREEFIG